VAKEIANNSEGHHRMAKSTVGRVFALFQPRVVVVGWISLYKRNCGIHANKALEMKSFNFCLFYQACETEASRRKHCYSESSFVAWDPNRWLSTDGL